MSGRGWERLENLFLDPVSRRIKHCRRSFWEKGFGDQTVGTSPTEEKVLEMSEECCGCQELLCLFLRQPGKNPLSVKTYPSPKNIPEHLTAGICALSREWLQTCSWNLVFPEQLFFFSPPSSPAQCHPSCPGLSPLSLFAAWIKGHQIIP